MKQFNLSKSKKTLDDEDDTLDAAATELLKLAGNINLEEQITASADAEDAKDDAEGWVDEHDEMTQDEG